MSFNTFTADRHKNQHQHKNQLNNFQKEIIIKGVGDGAIMFFNFLFCSFSCSSFSKKIYSIYIETELIVKFDVNHRCDTDTQ